MTFEHKMTLVHFLRHWLRDITLSINGFKISVQKTIHKLHSRQNCSVQSDSNYHKNAFQEDAYRPLVTVRGWGFWRRGLPNRDPPGQKPPWKETLQTKTALGHVTCSACWDRDSRPPTPPPPSRGQNS